MNKKILENYPSIKTLNSEQQKYVLENLKKEVEYRRDKAWKIFSWASTILLAIIGGLIALATNTDPDKHFELLWCPHKILLLTSVLILAAYSILWVERNLSVEHDVLDEIKSYEIKLGIRTNQGINKKTVFEKLLSRFGYRETIVLLTIAAIASIISIQ